MLSFCQKGANMFSHLSSHELPEARRKRERGHQQGDEGGVHQPPDRKRWTVGSLIGVLFMPYVCSWFTVLWIHSDDDVCETDLIHTPTFLQNNTITVTHSMRGRILNISERERDQGTYSQRVKHKKGNVNFQKTQLMQDIVFRGICSFIFQCGCLLNSLFVNFVIFLEIFLAVCDFSTYIFFRVVHFVEFTFF